ncbi:MAG: hypothetical protein WCT07_03415 [Candidatus Paceibacterota bacterium]
MTTAKVRPSVEVNLGNLVHDSELWNSILNYDLSVVTKTFKERNPEYAADAEILEIECKRFMYLAAVAPNLDLAPTKPIDSYWHQFILFTPEYEEFCRKFNGYFVHHNPLAGPDHETIFTRTRNMVIKLFGKFDNVNWWLLPRPATSCKCTRAGQMV